MWKCDRLLYICCNWSKGWGANLTLARSFQLSPHFQILKGLPLALPQPAVQAAWRGGCSRGSGGPRRWWQRRGRACHFRKFVPMRNRRRRESGSQLLSNLLDLDTDQLGTLHLWLQMFFFTYWGRHKEDGKPRTRIHFLERYVTRNSLLEEFMQSNNELYLRVFMR